MAVRKMKLMVPLEDATRRRLSAMGALLGLNSGELAGRILTDAAERWALPETLAAGVEPLSLSALAVDPGQLRLADATPPAVKGPPIKKETAPRRRTPKPRGAR